MFNFIGSFGYPFVGCANRRGWVVARDWMRFIAALFVGLAVAGGSASVWFIIWPNQKKVLGLVAATPEEKAAAAKLAGTSRINTMLSIPMLNCIAQQNGGL